MARAGDLHVPVFEAEKERHSQDEKVQKRGPIYSLLPQELRQVKLQDITHNIVNIIHQNDRECHGTYPFQLKESARARVGAW